MRANPGQLSTRAAIAAALAWASVGCGGSPGAGANRYPDATVFVDAGTPDAVADSAPGSFDAVDRAPSRPPRTGLPLPANVRPPARILDAHAQLAGNGHSACTHQIPASDNGDRWCAFFHHEPAAHLAELWVINVTQAARGDVPACDGSSTGCFRLTTTLAVRSATFFDGDTLIYHADPGSASNEDFLGPIYAWRPGWSAGRQISSNRGFTCIGHRRVAAAACFDDPEGPPAKRDSAQVRAGYLLNQTGGPLPVFGRWPLRNDDDVAWDAGFSPDGSVFALSVADSIGKKQTMRIAPTADVGQVPPALAIDDIEYWRIANDGTKIYFIRGLPQQADLFIADFPSGANQQMVEAGIRGFSLIGSQPDHQAVAYKKHLGGANGEFRLLRDRASAPKTIFAYDDIVEIALISSDLRYTAWMDAAFRGIVIDNGDLSRCLLDVADEPAVYDPAFLERAGLIFWKEPSADDPDRRDGFFAAPDRCRPKTRFAQGVEYFVPVGDRGVVLGDEHVEGSGRSTLKYVAVSSDGAGLDPGGPIRVQEEVAAPVIFVGADAPLLVYKGTDPVSGSDGIFVFGPVPF